MWARIQDPDHTILHRALRVAIVMPLLFAVGLVVLHDPQFALLAAFGSFSALAMADFMGPRRSRLGAHLVLGLLGTVLVVAGTALSNTLWAAVIAMLAIGVALQLVVVLGGQFALGNNAAILSFVVCVMVPAGNGAIGSRIAGWITAMVCSALAATFLWPRHERRDLYQRIAEALRPLGAAARAVAQEVDPGSANADAMAANERVREVFRALGFRPIGPPEHQQALLGLIDALGQACRFASLMAACKSATAADRDLARAIATTLDAMSGVLQACAEARQDASIEIGALVTARHQHLELLDAGAARALASHATGAAIVAEFTDVFAFRVLSYIVLSMAVDALVMSGRSVTIDDDFVIIESPAPVGAWRLAINVLKPHLAPRSVWFHNSLRAGLALALSVLVAKVSDVSHAFWVVLATLSILRSNVATTGTTVISAIVGTTVGFVLATAAITALGPHPMLLWVSLPFAVFLAGYAPSAVSFGAGQAMFALLVVELFNLMVPEGWSVGEVRLEAVAMGAAVALVASLIMWPKGAAAALREEVAAHVRAGRRLAEAAFGALFAAEDPAEIGAARAAAFAARHRAEEALAAYIGERGAKHVPLDVWGWIARVPIAMRVASDAAIAMRRSGYVGIDSGDAPRLFDDPLRVVCASYGESADRLEEPGRVPDPALRAAIADFDMVDGAGQQRAAIVAATVAYLDSHRDDPDTIKRVMATVWGLGWLSYLAHIRADSEAPLTEVLSRADTPWWR